MVLSKKESCAALVVITLVLMAAASLLADPAWAQAELTVNKTGSPGTVEEGGEVTYTVVVTNTEDATADEVVVRDTLPPGARFISAETEDGTCTPPGSDPVVVCELGAIEAGESETVTIKARDCMKSPERWRIGAPPGAENGSKEPLLTSRATEDPLSRSPRPPFHTVSEGVFSEVRPACPESRVNTT